MNNTRLALLLLAAAVALSACGNKGPLVLPDKPAETPTPSTEAAPIDTSPADTAPTSETAPATVPEEDGGTPVAPEPLPQEDDN
jgi:predicted small lipoprotein YifL